MTPWLITIFTVIAVYFLDKWDNRFVKSVFNWVPAILFAYLIPAGISALLQVDFSADGIHDYSKTYFIPLAIVAVMSSLSLRQLKSIGWKPILLFVSGSAWIALFPVALALALTDTQMVSGTFIEAEFWKGLPPIVGSWIGGSTSQLVLKEIVECPENVFLTVLVLDNILVNIWTILMFQTIKRSRSLNKLLHITKLQMPSEIERLKNRVVKPVFCFVILLGTVWLANLSIESFVLKIVILSVLGLALSNLVRTWHHQFALKLGSVLILIVMAVLGLKLKFDAIAFETSFVLFLIVWLLSHFIFMLAIAKVLNINTAWVPIASMANVGGIATAPAVTAAYEKKWMPHAIILAILSMATGTFWGMLTIYLLQVFLV